MHLLLAALVAVGSAGLTPADEPPGAPPSAPAVERVLPISRAAPAPRDTIVWPDLAAPRPLDPPRALPLVLPPGPTTPPTAWLARARARLAEAAGPEARLRALLRARVAALSGQGRPAFAAVPSAGDARPDSAPEAALPVLLGSVAELGMRVRGRAELGGHWSRYRPCLDAFQETCDPDLLPQLSPELLFSVQLGGVIQDRLRVDVDFDQLDPFAARSTINVVYEGLPGERIRRLEVGDVTFATPRSRFLTEGVPVDNFGFQASGSLGPLDVRAVWAEQKGLPLSRVFRLSGTGAGRGFVQADTVELDDADYVDGQFFFLVDPAAIVDYPHVDVLSLDGSEVAPHLAPGPEPIQLYRYEAEPALRHQVQGLIQADAVAEKGGETLRESGWFRYLQPGVDYWVHPSGLWLALRIPLSRDEMLAVTYVTATGVPVGDYNPEIAYNTGRRPELRLLKASAANHQPDRPTWESEMHQLYRVSNSPDVEPGSVEVTVSIGDPGAGRTHAHTGTGEEITFLTLFGLDEDAPLDRVDPAFVWEPSADPFGSAPGVPGTTLAGDALPVQGTFLVFPTLRPFLDPPPLRSRGMDETETRQVLGGDANPEIYEDPDPFERDNAVRFLLTVPFRVRSEGVISSFSLDAVGIREGSERVYVDDRLLTRLQDYEIDYELGQVTLLDPEALFAADPEAPIRATFEQRQSFRTAPTSVLGLAARTSLGAGGELEVVSLWQQERTLAVRPTLGLEPAAIGLAGINGRYAGELPWLASTFAIDGEIAGSLPTPNTKGDAFLDDFDAPADRGLSLLATDWRRGSAPAEVDGAELHLPPAVDETTYGGVVWQHAWILEGAQGDSLGVREGFLPRQEIDRGIRIAGSEVREAGLRVALGGPADRSLRWASVTTALSPTGTDLTKSEFLEVYVAGGQGLSLVVDLGDLSEDALFADADGFTGGVKDNGAPWGLGVLDHEADPSRGEIWGDEADRRGVWDEACTAQRGRIYRAGDPTAVCTRGNGRPDHEDLNGNGVLDLEGRHLRWVVELDGTSPYLVRPRGETGTAFQLYRLPLQGMRDAEVGGVFAEADMRAVRSLRLTVTGDRPQALTLARMRIVGSRWIRRGEDGVLEGVAGDRPALMGRVEAAPVSRVTEGEAYQSPPGVLEQLADPTAAIGGQGVEFAEKSLAIRFEDVEPGARAEVYNRFPQSPRAFLGYREARLWVTARSGPWGAAEPTFFFFKVGTDPENFYLYRTRLPAPADAGQATPGDWLPEVVVDFDEWLTLRRLAELELERSPRGAGDPPLEMWSADSTYAVVLGDRGRSPDLANVREMSFGVWNGGRHPISGEVWVDELRLSRGADDAGVAAHLNVSLTAGDVLDARLTVSDRGAFFRQLQDEPTYQGDRRVSFTSTLRLDRLAPDAWGVELPLTLSLDGAGQDPAFLSSSDVRADRLPGLRDTGARRTRVSLGFAKRTPSGNPWVDLLLGGVSANVGWFRASDGTLTSRVDASGVDARLGWSRLVAERTLPLVPSFLAPALRALLPGFLEAAVLDARLRWTPERLAAGATWLRHESDVRRFDGVLETTGDAAAVPTHAPRRVLESSAQVTFRPFGPLAADVTFTNARDLLPPERATSDPAVQARLREAHGSWAGVDLGWETRRVVRTGASFRPRVLPWLRHDLDWSASFATDRHPSYLLRDPDALAASALPRNASGDRSLGVVLGVEPGALARLLAWIEPITWSRRSGLGSRFTRAPVDPGAAYQLGLGGKDDFRFLGLDTAAVLSDRTVTRWTGGVRLPLGLRVDVARATTDAEVLDVRSARTVQDDVWPNVQLRLDSLPLPGLLQRALTRVSLAGGWTESLRVADLGGRSAQRRTLADRELPVDVSLTWRGGSVTGYAGSFLEGEGADPTGVTRRRRDTHRVSIGSRMAPPFGLAELLDRPLALTLILSQVAESECRTTVARLACVPFIDQVTRSVGLTLSALVRGLEVGVEGAYTDRRSFVGQRPGATQFQLGVFGEFQVDVGALPGRTQD